MDSKTNSDLVLIDEKKSIVDDPKFQCNNIEKEIVRRLLKVKKLEMLSR